MSQDQAQTQEVTGVWQGFYSYAEGDEGEFTATLLDSGAHVTGAIHEPDLYGDTEEGLLYAEVAGRRSGGSVAFTKTYDGTGGWDHSVDYEGTLSADGTEIEGGWTIPGVATGRFLMIRSGSRQAERAEPVAATTGVGARHD